jgi:hypothetical protein
MVIYGEVEDVYRFLARKEDELEHTLSLIYYTKLFVVLKNAEFNTR